jgi:hypothetical protein
MDSLEPDGGIPALISQNFPNLSLQETSARGEEKFLLPSWGYQGAGRSP